ncbi:O-antigen ligase family protein, partial [Bacteroidota bacterium]
PLFSFLIYEGTGVNPSYLFGFICLCLLIIRLFSIYSSAKNLLIPNYVILFGVFTFYTILSSIFVSNELIEEGAFKYLYSNSFLLTFFAFVVIENTSFPPSWMKIAIKVLGFTLIIAAIVSVVQIFEPLFLVKGKSLIKGLSFERIEEYYRNNPEEETGSISRFLSGYRLSIYSYINGISVGIDTICILSLLIALKSQNWVKTGVWVVAAALVSFLSSARWIMLNFLVVASQIIWISKNKLLNTFKYVLFGVMIIIFLVPIIEYSGMDIQKFIEERLLSKSAYTRILAFEIFSKVYLDNPIFGTGGVNTPKMERLISGRTSQIHVGYLKLFYYYGLVGGVIYLTFLASLLNRLWKMAQRSNYWGGFFAFLAFAIANLTLVELDLFYFGLLLALIFSNHFYYEGDKSLSSASS